ncbi:MAG: hypothetical protein IPM21_10870 [Acidobacteria bacterium]|nr:hypothetical protein [Acidobacteriota bacterium]
MELCRRRSGDDAVWPSARMCLRSVRRRFEVDAGTRFRVRMNETLSSKTARVGDNFTTTVREPVYSTNGVVVIPVGSEVISGLML